MTGRVAITAGFRVRNRIKAGLDYHNIMWKEYRGFLKSSFSGWGEDDDVKAFYEWLKEEFP